MGDDVQKFLMESMSEIRELVNENNAVVREMRGEMREFKEHVMGRVERLEKNEGERTKNLFSTFSLLISSAALAVTVIVNFFRHGK
jgi:hypothetical protein